MSDAEDAPRFDNAKEETAYWRMKAQDLQDMLKEAEASLKDFAESSKELEQEMERELAQSAKDLEETKTRSEKLFSEREEWKSKYQVSLHQHNKALAENQMELDQLKKSHTIYRDKLRDLELDNDELENTERMVRSSLNDAEQRYHQQMEKTTLLEQELIDKSGLEEENQRLRDEVRELNEEIAALREREIASAYEASSHVSDQAPKAMPSRARDTGELKLEDLVTSKVPTDSRPESSSSMSRQSEGEVNMRKSISPSKQHPARPPSTVPRTPLAPRKSLIAHHSRRNSREFGKTITNGHPSAQPDRIADSSASTTRSRQVTNSRSNRARTGNLASLNKLRAIQDQMAALQNRMQRANSLGPTASSTMIPSTPFDPDKSALPRPSSRLGASVSGRASSAHAVDNAGGSTSTMARGPRPSFDGKSSIPIASSALNRSVRRPTSRLSMGPSSVRPSEKYSPQDNGTPAPSSYAAGTPARSMTPTMYTSRARAHPKVSINPSELTRGPSSGAATSSSLDFLNKEPEPTRSSSRTGFTPRRDSLVKGRRVSQHHARTGSASVDGADAFEASLRSVNRPRGSTMVGASGGGGGESGIVLPSGGHSKGTSYAGSSRFTPSTAHARAQEGSNGGPSSSSSSSSTLSSVTAFRDSRLNKSRPSSALGSRSHRPLSGLLSGNGPPPPSWKQRNDPLVAGAEGGMRRSRSSSVGSNDG
ncbi:unnamed protein product [Jaminaea pallidilutea]